MREYIKHLQPGQTFIMDNPMGHRTEYVADKVRSEGGKTSVEYHVPSAPEARGWALTRPSMSLVTIVS